ncbi:hypothetical protein LGV61_06290 [Desulfurispirillum indicum]|uniref:Uncharacterized protein n=1 Tax=Desulfurispirillum indicum (strain ATCC BAA-1389 / DSM 22839 / S5) TaxID=653733 RepID=E6W4G8_DESIS|nr:hypothetical protein [Desulfurispirillum indicum]ADU65942.1 hypothetical protein Selin_1207 [Desulfurispirillum indicum S5]UCZ57876.1 hypothetical protein LGV61_06290 [Desulfurispirillum indicum]
MGTILKYQDGREAVVQLASKEKLSIEVVQTGLQIQQLKFYGLVAASVVARWSREELPDFFRLFAADQPPHLFFQEAVSAIKEFESIEALKNHIASTRGNHAGTS